VQEAAPAIHVSLMHPFRVTRNGAGSQSATVDTGVIECSPAAPVRRGPSYASGPADAASAGAVVAECRRRTALEGHCPGSHLRGSLAGRRGRVELSTGGLINLHGNRT